MSPGDWGNLYVSEEWWRGVKKTPINKCIVAAGSSKWTLLCCGSATKDWEPGESREPGELSEMVWGTCIMSRGAAEEWARWLSIICCLDENPLCGQPLYELLVFILIKVGRQILNYSSDWCGLSKIASTTVLNNLHITPYFIDVYLVGMELLYVL